MKSRTTSKNCRAFSPHFVIKVTDLILHQSHMTIDSHINIRRGYVSAVKDEKEPDDPGKVVYTLDTRFAVDVGKRRLMRAYFATLGQDMDIGLLQEFKDEEAADEKMRADEGDGEEKN